MKIKFSLVAMLIVMAGVSYAESTTDNLTTNQTATVDGSQIQVINGGEGYKFATVSLKDMSRIHCTDPMGNVFYSKEKEIEIKSAGNDAYVKILPRKTTDDNGERIEYGSHPREMYVECSGQTFSLVLVPKDIPAQTIVLKVPFTDIKKASEYEKANPYDTTMLDLVKKAYTGDVPDGYEPVHVGKEIKSFEELSLVLLRSYVGSRYTVHEYIIDAKKQVNLSESMFIPYLKNPLSISIVKSNLAPTEQTRMLVVSLNQDAENENVR